MIVSGSADSGTDSSDSDASLILCRRVILHNAIETTKAKKFNPTVDTSSLLPSPSLCLLGRVIFRHQGLFHLWRCWVIQFSGAGNLQLGSRVGNFLSTVWIEIYNRRIRGGTIFLCFGIDHNIPYIYNGRALFQEAGWNSRDWSVSTITKLLPRSIWTFAFMRNYSATTEY